MPPDPLPTGAREPGLDEEAPGAPAAPARQRAALEDEAVTGRAPEPSAQIGQVRRAGRVPPVGRDLAVDPADQALRPRAPAPAHLARRDSLAPAYECPEIPLGEHLAAGAGQRGHVDRRVDRARDEMESPRLEPSRAHPEPPAQPEVPDDVARVDQMRAEHAPFRSPLRRSPPRGRPDGPAPLGIKRSSSCRAAA